MYYIIYSHLETLSWTLEYGRMILNHQGEVAKLQCLHYRLNQVDRNQTVLWYPQVTFTNSVENEITVIDKHTRTNVLRYTRNMGSDPSLAQEG